MAKRRQSAAPKDPFDGLPATQIAKIWGVTCQAVGQWQKAGCPRNRDGTYNLGNVIAWREQRASGTATRDRDAEETRRTAALADTYEFKLAALRGEYLPAGKVAAFWTERVLELRSGLQAMGQALAPQLHGLAPQQAKDLVDDNCRRLCEAMARTWESSLVEEGSDDAAEAES